jgi:hypothetical protein
LQVVLVGQPELAARLNQPELRQLKQRIALRCTLDPMSMPETAAYVAGRIRMAGGDAAKLFTREAVAEVFERSQGIPRLVNVICDNALVNGFALAARPVARQIVIQVCHDFDFSTGHGVKRTVVEDQPRPVAGQSSSARSVDAATESPTPPVMPSDSTPSTAVADRQRFSLFGNLKRGSR